MMERQPPRRQGFVATEDQPLIGIIATDNDGETIRYFVDEQEADAAIEADGIERALSLAGAWKDLGNWAEVERELDRIRHESPPTPPVEL
jgi:hypothetical protein